MSFKPSEFPGGYERHCLRRINHAELFAQQPDDSSVLLAESLENDRVFAATFSQQFEATLERTVVLKPSEDTEVVLAVKAELDRLYTMTGSLSGDNTDIQQALKRLIKLTMESVKRAAGSDALALKELQQEEDARVLHFNMLKCNLVADLLNSHSGVEGKPGRGVFIPPAELVPSLLSIDKADLAEVVQLFDQPQVAKIIQEAEVLLQTLQSAMRSEEATLNVSRAVEKFEFIKGYGVYLARAETSVI